MICQDTGFLTMSRGKATPITVYLSSEHGEVVTGLTATGYVATEKGGAKITSPDTDFTLTEDTSTSATRRRYKGVVTSTVGDALIDTGASSFWVAIVVAGVVMDWLQVRVIEHAVVPS
jgi:hypothetical protein